LTRPTAGGKAWKIAHIDSAAPTDVAHLGPQARITDIACPSTRLCVALDDGADVLTSTDPTGGPRAWHSARLGFTAPLADLACASVFLCIAADNAGNVGTSTDPTAGARGWTVSRLDPDGYLTSICARPYPRASPATTPGICSSVKDPRA
jgi:hypothetical protein